MKSIQDEKFVSQKRKNDHGISVSVYDYEKEHKNFMSQKSFSSIEAQKKDKKNFDIPKI